MSISDMGEFVKRNEPKIVLFVGLLLISAISFEVGKLQGQKWQQKPLVIEKQINAPQEGDQTSQGNSGPSGAFSATKADTQKSTSDASGCAFVGSKNSNIFYVPTCAWAKKIKPENLVCYKSEQEAISKGKTKRECN